jgi:tetratricopeptide (TPR) repeat protein
MSDEPANRGDRLRAAEKLYAKGQYQKALEALETISEGPDVLKAKAQNLTMLGQTAKALGCLKKVVKNRPSDPSAHIELAAFLTGQGRYKQAVGAYDRAILLEPEAAVIHRNRALALRLCGNHDAALNGYEAALRLDGNDGDNWAAKADLLIELHRFSEAIECLEKADAASTRSLNAIGWSSRGSSLAREGGFDEAIRCYDRALEKDPREHSAILGKASALQQKGDVDGALACYDRLIEVLPNDASGLLRKGRLLIHNLRFDEALRCFEAAVKLDSDSSYGWSDSAYCRQKLGEPGEALQDYERAIDLDPREPLYWEGKGVCLYELGRHGEAVNAWHQALKLDPNLLWSNANIGFVLADIFKKTEEALQWYDRAIKLGPDEATPTINKAKALAELKRVSEAESLLKEMLERVRAEEKGWVLRSLGVIFSEYAKDAQKALVVYEQVLALGVTDQSCVLEVAEQLVRLGRYEEGRARVLGTLQKGDLPPQFRPVATFLLYVSHALEGDLEKASSCFSEFLDRLIEVANSSDFKPPVVGYRYDGLADTIVNSSADLATKFKLLVAIDLQTGQLVAPSPRELREFAHLIQLPAAPPAVVVPE